ncbi:MAG: glutamate racemase, partial [Candidatus Levyibacteriota bacterium]
MDDRPIGILDSGVGGLSVWEDIAKELPHESLIYIGDSANCPYGNKPVDLVYKLGRRLVTFLLSKDVKLIVVACNSITVSSIDKLRSEFPNIPIVGSAPVVKTAAAKTKNERIGILSTGVTSSSDYQRRLIQTFARGMKVVNNGSNKLVPLVEEGITEGEIAEAILKEELQPFIRFDVDVLAL